MININKLTNDDIKIIIKEIKEGSIKTNFEKELINELYKELRNRGEKEQNNTINYLEFGVIAMMVLISVICIVIGMDNLTF